MTIQGTHGVLMVGGKTLPVHDWTMDLQGTPAFATHAPDLKALARSHRVIAHGLVKTIRGNRLRGRPDLWGTGFTRQSGSCVSFGGTPFDIARIKRIMASAPKPPDEWVPCGPITGPDGEVTGTWLYNRSEYMRTLGADWMATQPPKLEDCVNSTVERYLARCMEDKFLKAMPTPFIHTFKVPELKEDPEQ